MGVFLIIVHYRPIKNRRDVKEPKITHAIKLVTLEIRAKVQLKL